MRILFIASRFPYPPLRGDQVRSYHFLRMLSPRHEITLIAPTPPSSRRRDKDRIADLGIRLVEVRVGWWQRVLNLTRFPHTELPFQVLYYCPPVFKAVVERLLQEDCYDVMHVQLARMAPAVESVVGIPKVMDFVDALSVNMLRRAKRERWPLTWALNVEAERMRRYERQLTLIFEAQLASSQADAHAIAGREGIYVVPNGVDLEEFPFIEEGREEKLILFTGRMSYFPNAEAATYFATKVFPLVMRQEPGARFVIVGADPPPRVRRLARLPGVEVTGYVPRMQDYLRKATVAVAPLLSGTGIQNKVLEAMASGLPVVASPYASAGLEVVPGKHLLVGTDERELAALVLRLLEDRDLRIHVARNARRLVEDKYTWQRAVTRLEAVYLTAIRKVRSHNPAGV